MDRQDTQLNANWSHRAPDAPPDGQIRAIERWVFGLPAHRRRWLRRHVTLYAARLRNLAPTWLTPDLARALAVFLAYADDLGLSPDELAELLEDAPRSAQLGVRALDAVSGAIRTSRHAEAHRTPDNPDHTPQAPTPGREIRWTQDSSHDPARRTGRVPPALPVRRFGR